MQRRFLSPRARAAAVRRAVPVTALAAAGVLAVAVPGQAAPLSAAAPAVRSAAPAPSSTLSVTVQLAAQDEAAVRTLAQARSLDRGSRLRALAAAAPSASTANQVRGYLASQGLTVTGSTPYSVKVTGPASTVRALFGTVGSTRKSLHLPTALNGLATAAVGGDTVGHPMRHHAPTPITGAQARALYRAPAGTPQAGKAAPTIATVQFDGWNSSDLSTFARNNGYPDPVASKQYTAISVDGADPNTSLFGGDVEVALDQEALLATAPSAKQRAYFTPNGDNSDQTLLDALNTITADASNPNVAYHITALSISWGNCEAFHAAGAFDGLHAAFTNLNAAGVTVFAASGDAGAYDCANPNSDPGNLNQTLAVDYPASDPAVVGVGGTTVDINSPYSTAAPKETTWWTPGGGTLSTYQGSGGGGGVSSYFARPDYQAAAAPSAANRNVPDLALDADLASGLGIVLRGRLATVGGTSLAAPLAAATLTDLLASKGLEYGIGDIHTALYTSASTGFRDITSGSNGYYAAGPGYDDASGLGAPDWTAMTPALLPGLAGSQFVPMTPCRIFDTRSGTGTCASGVTVGKAALGAGKAIAVKVAGANGIPSNATAVVLNVTAVSPTAATFLSVYPTGASRPASSNLNLVAGQAPTPNAVVVPVGAGGKVSFFNHAGTVQVLADVSGYYTASGSKFAPLTPCRVFDTRSGTGTCAQGLTVPAAPLGNGKTLTVKLAGTSGVPADATAVVLNVTGVSPTASTFVTVYPTATGRPATSNLNLVKGQGPRPNLVIVPVDANGQVSFYNQFGTVHLIADITGYFTTSSAVSGGLTYPVTPCRVFDTRSGSGTCPAAGKVKAAPLGSGQSIDVTVAGANGIPSSAKAVILNVTAVSPTAATFVTAYPTGSARPNTSNLNLLAGQGPTPNLVLVPIGTGGRVSFYNKSGSVYLLADVAGYVS